MVRRRTRLPFTAPFICHTIDEPPVNQDSLLTIGSDGRSRLNIDTNDVVPDGIELALAHLFRSKNIGRNVWKCPGLMDSCLVWSRGDRVVVGDLDSVGADKAIG